MFIYILKNKINEKCYVGQDSGSVEKLTRVNDHFSLARRVISGKELKYKSKLIPALIKYGIDQFDVYIHSANHSSKEELNNAEIELIAKLDSIKNGYNIMPGGQGFISNSCIKDTEVLSSMREVRARGAKSANEKRWANASQLDRIKIWESMRDGRISSNWREKITESWRNLSEEDRKNRSHQMKQGRPFRFILMKNGQDIIIETNLRTLLSKLEIVPISKKEIERHVRNEAKFTCKEFSIEKRRYR